MPRIAADNLSFIFQITESEAYRSRTFGSRLALFSSGIQRWFFHVRIDIVAYLTTLSVPG
jgi:hypothetical protein